MSKEETEHKCKFYVNSNWTYLSCDCGKRKYPNDMNKLTKQMSKEQVKQKAKAIVDKYSIKLIVKTIGYIDFENASIQCALLEVQSKIDLLEKMKQKVYARISIFNNELNHLKQVKTEIESM